MDLRGGETGAVCTHARERGAALATLHAATRSSNALPSTSLQCMRQTSKKSAKTQVATILSCHSSKFPATAATGQLCGDFALSTTAKGRFKEDSCTPVLYVTKFQSLLRICSQVNCSSENEALDSFFKNGSGRIDVAVQETIDARKISVFLM